MKYDMMMKKMTQNDPCRRLPGGPATLRASEDGLHRCKGFGVKYDRYIESNGSLVIFRLAAVIGSLSRGVDEVGRTLFAERTSNGRPMRRQQ